MKIEEFKNMIRELVRQELTNMTKQDSTHEEICEGEGCLDEKSVPQPYNRNAARKMTKSQINLRKKIGDAMMRDEKKVSKFRKKYGDDWKDYLWASASAAAFRQVGSTKSDDKKKK
jgi:hypothetical protein